jgi:hypothetical protein
LCPLGAGGEIGSYISAGPKGAIMNLNVTTAMADARRAMTDSAFQQAASMMSEAKRAVCEEMQKETSPRIEMIVENLASGEPLSADDLALVKEWIVGDASGYTDMENNFNDWLAEYDRLEASLARYEGRDCSSDELLQLQGILEDATRISYDIATFLEKQERVKRFDDAVADGLDEYERDALARVLANKLRSPNY